MNKAELLSIIESQQETINTLTKLLELELAKDKYRLPDPPNWDLFKYGEMLKPSCKETTITPNTTLKEAMGLLWPTGKGISEGVKSKGGVGTTPTQDRPPPPKPPEARLIKNGKWINKGEHYAP